MTADPVPWTPGSCHCGAVAFRVRVRAREAIACSCSICTLKGFLHLIVPPEDFELLTGADDLTLYTFGTHTAKHRFCRHCGIHAFYTPRSHPDHVDVNVHALHGTSPDDFRIVPFDGRNWEDNIDAIR
ncbi:MAG: GFA family protein [Alphaproteobacteria bacterium]|nr:GFA family protein [Alphaproteobacteria bacterium]